MTRRILKFVLVAGLVLTAGHFARAQDQVFLKSDSKKPLLGTIEKESAAGITLKLRSGSTDKISARDIRDVTYDLKGGGEIKLGFYGPARSAEADIDKATTASRRKDALDRAVRAWQALEDRLKGTSFDQLKRHVAYKIARLKVRQARAEGGSTTAAVGLLKDYVKSYPNSWQVLPAAHLLGQLLVENKDYKEAEQVFDDLAGQSSLPPDLREEFQLLAGQALVQGKDYNRALTKFQGIAEKLPPNSRGRLKAEVYLAECLAETNKVGAAEQKLNGVLEGAKDDKELKALAYNALGYCHYQQKQYKDALWDFLRVDVVYNQNKEEQAKALYYLAKLFTTFKDEDHAKECLARLRSSEFAGTDYQGKLLREGAK